MPEHLIGKPDELNKLRDDIGLPQTWNVSADYNLVPSCDPCNSRKRSTVLPRNQLILLLTSVNEKAAKVSRLRERFEREDQADALRSKLEFALASGLLSENDVNLAMAKAVAGDDLVQLTTKLDFLNGVTLDKLRPSAVAELLDLPVKLGSDLPEGLQMTHDVQNTRYVRTSREYKSAVEDGFYCLSNFDIKMGSFFEIVVQVLDALAACRPSQQSYIRHPRKGLSDVDLLPSNMLPMLGPSTDEYDEVIARYESVGDAIAAGRATIMRTSSSAITLQFDCSGMVFREMLRADLDGDGFEDLLVSTYAYAVHGSMGFTSKPIVLARRDAASLFVPTSMVCSPANFDAADRNS